MRTRGIPMRWTILCVILGCILPAHKSLAAPPLRVTVDFDSMANYATSQGTTRTATPSGLSPTDRAAIIAKTQQKFDQTLGPGQVVVSEGTGGDMNIIVSGENSTTSNLNTYGNMGAPSAPGVVYAGTFASRMTGGNQTFPPGSTALANALGETLAHEIAHKLGVNHNSEPNALMGPTASDAARAADNRSFIGNDVAIMRRNIPLASAAFTQPPAAFSEAAPTGTEGPGGYEPQLLGDDTVMETELDFVGPADSSFGYITASDQFAFQADTTDSNWTMDFAYTFPYDFAVQLDDGSVIDAFQSMDSSFQLLDPNPNFSNPGLTYYETLVETFDTPEGSATATLSVTDPTVDMGFVVSVPEPQSMLLLSIPALIPMLRRRFYR